MSVREISLIRPVEFSSLLAKGPHHRLASVSFQNRADKKRLNIIIVAEGAIDCHNKAITPDYIKDVSEQTRGFGFHIFTTVIGGF